MNTDNDHLFDSMGRYMGGNMIHIKSYDDASDPVAGQEWTTESLQADFTVQAFAAPFVLVTRKADGVKGSLRFKHSPRVYYGFEAN